MRTRRVMRRKNVFEIEERIGDGNWTPICECSSIEEAKELLRDLKILEGEEK